MDLMRKAKSVTTNSEAIYHNMALISYLQNKTNDALRYFEKALEINPNSTDIITNLEIVRTGGELEIDWI